MATELVPSATDLLRDAQSKIVKVRHFKSGKIDRFGKVVGVVELIGKAIPDPHQDHHYDAEGRVVLLEKFMPGVAKPSIRLYRYRDWQVLDSLWVDPDGVVENYHRYSYDPSTTNLIWRAEYDHQGKLFYSIRSEYDAKGRLSVERWFDAQNRPARRNEYTWDAADELAAEARFDASGALVGTLRFKYDKKGNVLERAWHGPTGTRNSRLVYTQDLKGRVTKVEARGVGDKLELRQEFGYDAIGNVVSEKIIDPKGKVLKSFKHFV